MELETPDSQTTEDVSAVPQTEEGGEPESASAASEGQSEGGLTPDQLVEQVRQRVERGELAPDKLSFLDRKFQSAFSTRLNNFKSSVDQVGQKLAEAGIKLPEGKTMYDMLSEEGGSGFVKLLSGVVNDSIAPIKDKISKAENDQMVRSQIALAQSQYPEVKKHFETAVQIADSNPDLQEAALVQGGRYLPYVLAGVAMELEKNELKAKLAEMAKALEKAGVATKTGGRTTLTGGKIKKGDEGGNGRSLESIAGAMFDKIKAGDTLGS